MQMSAVGVVSWLAWQDDHVAAQQHEGVTAETTASKPTYAKQTIPRTYHHHW